MIYFVSGLVICGLLRWPDASKAWCGGTELLPGLLSAAACTVLCKGAHVVLSKWGKNLPFPIEMELLEGKFAVGKEWMRQDIILIWFFH